MGVLSRKYWRPDNDKDFDFTSALCNKAEVDFHLHHGFTISAVKSGTLHMSFTGYCTLVRPGELLLLGPDVPQALEGAENIFSCNFWSLTHWGMDANLELEKRLSQERETVCKIMNTSLWQDFVKEMQIVEQGGQKASSIGDLSSDLLYSISKNIIWKFEVRSQAILAAKEHLDYHYKDKIEIEALASTVGLSPRHFFRLFKHELGMTPHRYINQLRINKARRMMRGGFPLLYLVHELGFADQSHFSKTFLKYTGTSPTKYSVCVYPNRSDVMHKGV